MNIVVKYGAEFTGLGDKSQYMDEFVRRVKGVVTVADLNLTEKIRFFSQPIPENITARDLHFRLRDLLDAIYRVKSRLSGDYLVVAQTIGLMSKLSSLQDSVEDAKAQVRKEL